MACIYLGLGVYILISKNIFLFDSWQKIGFGSLLISYGLFRFYRTIKKMKQQKMDEGDNVDE